MRPRDGLTKQMGIQAQSDRPTEISLIDTGETVKLSREIALRGGAVHSFPRPGHTPYVRGDS